MSSLATRRFTVDEYQRMADTGVPETWVVDLVHRQVEVHRQPGPEGYATSRVVGPGETLEVGALADVTVEVGWLLS